MKTIFLSLAFFTHLLLSAQNYVSNPGFELITETNPMTGTLFYESEVTGWFAVGNRSLVRDQFIGCFNNTVTVNPLPLGVGGARFAQIYRLHGIVNKLTRPIYPNQRLNVEFFANVLPCSPEPRYLVEFYLSNTAINSPHPFLAFLVNPLNYVKVGEVEIGNPPQYGWMPYQATIVAKPYLNYIPCAYQYLVIVLRHTENGDNQADNNFAFIDNLQVTEPVDCPPSMTSSILYNVDNAGVCSKVTLTAATSGMSPTNYIWDFGDGTCESSISPGTAHTYDQLGSYTVRLTVVDANGCISEASEEINVDCERCVGINPDFDTECIECQPVYVGDPRTHSTIFAGYSCKFNATDISTPSSGSTVTSWEWSDGSNVLSTQQNPVLNLSAVNTSGGQIPTMPTTTLCLQIQDANGCRAKICKLVSTPCIEDGGSTERATVVRSEMDVFPNPSGEGSVTLRLPDLQDAQLNVFNLQGQVVKKLNLPQGQRQIKLDMGDVSTGMYIFMVKDVRGFQQSRKVVIQNTHDK